MKLILVLILSFVTVTSLAQGPRSAGMGNAGLTLKDAYSGFSNQALNAFQDKFSLAAGYENKFLIPELGTSRFAAIVPTKAGHFGAVVSHFGFELYQELKAGVSFSRAFGEKFAAGLQLNYLRTALGEGYGSANNFTAELGFYAEVTNQLSFGAHLSNPNRSLLTSTPEEPLPTTIAAGAGYRFHKKLFTSGELYMQTGSKPGVRAGLEYQIHEMLWLRTGIATVPFQSTFGTSVNFGKLRFDVAAQWHQVLGVSPHGGLVYAFE